MLPLKEINENLRLLKVTEYTHVKETQDLQRHFFLFMYSRNGKGLHFCMSQICPLHHQMS